MLKHPSLKASEEYKIINSFAPKEYPFCGSQSFIKFGQPPDGDR